MVILKVLIGLSSFAAFFGIVFARGARLECFLAWIALMSLGSWLFGEPNPPARNQTLISHANHS